MKNFVASLLLIVIAFVLTVQAQEEARAAWQITSFDITASPQPNERILNATAVLNARNVGRASGATLTFRINSKVSIKSVTVGGVAATFRSSPESRPGLQRIVVTLPAPVAADGTTSVNVIYSFPVDNNAGLAAISAIGSQFLPLSFWYPIINTPFTIRGADTPPFHLSVAGPNVISSGIEKGAGTYDQPLNAEPFFVQGDWDRVDGTGDSQAIAAYIPKGAGVGERKQAEAILALAAAARAYYATAFGPPPNVPVRLVGVRRGSGFNDGGTVLLEAASFRRSKIDSSTALLISEAMARLWIGGQTPVRGEGGGVLRDGLVRFLAVQFLEKQFGREAAQAELQRERLAYAGVAKRDVPLSRTTQLDDTYFGAVPNKGAMVFRLIDRRLGRDVFLNVLKTQVQSGRDNSNGISLAGLRTALVERGGQRLQSLLDQQFDQPTDTDLMVGLPQQRGNEWVSALRNLGSTDAAVSVIATTEQGQQLSIEAAIPAKNFAEAVFKTTTRPVRVEVDPEKLYPQLDYSNDVAPRGRDIAEGMSEATRQFGSQDFVRAEAIAREIITVAPRMQEARVLLGRALLGQNKLDEAEKLFRSALDEPLPTASTMAWSNDGLAEISLKRGQVAEAAKRFDEAVRAEGEYASSVAARAGRIRAEGSSSPVDESAKAFIAQLDQT
ncbi:MAG TPA: tetratricopeptide repeat protein, partial [Pyrinomonadaceae bacterium]